MFISPDLSAIPLKKSFLVGADEEVVVEDEEEETGEVAPEAAPLFTEPGKKHMQTSDRSKENNYLFLLASAGKSN